MPVSKFKFVSPGVQIAEIDNSQLPKLPEAIGPVIIGRAERGPGMRPVKIDSMSGFVEVFGNPQPGGAAQDVWRNGGSGLSPTYGAYAAEAWLKNSSPITFVRLLGKEHTNRTTAGRAGWSAGSVNLGPPGNRSGGGWGLFLTSPHASSVATTGTLAATFYLTTGSVSLSGLDQGGGASIEGNSGLVLGSGANWKMVIKDGDGVATETVTFNFTENSKNYIRKVFNTNPTLTNATVTDTTKNYWLGETYDRAVADAGLSTPALGILLPLISSSVEQADQRREASKAQTPFIISQDLAGNVSSYDYQRLFQFKTLDAGSWEGQNLKVSIANVKASSDPNTPYGRFDVEVRLAKDSDNAKQIIERFSSCNLNPNSSDYVAKRIGDANVKWSYTERKYREYGSYPNQSKYIYIVMNSDVDTGATNESYLPFGFEGPNRWTQVLIISGTADEVQNIANLYVTGGYGASDDAILTAGATTTGSIYFSSGSATADDTNSVAFDFPSFPTRASSKVGNLASPKDAYFGIDTTMASSTRFEESYKDLVRPVGPINAAATGQTGDATLEAMEMSYLFTMEDLTYLTASVDALDSTLSVGFDQTSSTDAYYFSGSRNAGKSLSTTGSIAGSVVSASWNNVLKQGFDSFTVPLVGGCDGLDITEMEPFRNSTWGTDGGANGTSDSETTSYSFNSVKVAIDSCADPEVVECNVMSMPGLINLGLTNHVIKVCEDRADSLAVVDLPYGYTPRSEATGDDESRKGSVDNAVEAINGLENRALNTSYGCCYYPWVQIRDSEIGKSVWVPPSVAAIGTFSSTQRKSEIWFAPAGFTRGGLTEGAAGMSVINVKQRLTSKERDKLYEVNVNPIATFPAEGIVVFGQKTLQTTPSALDRVNVRRLMIFLKKEISRIAARLLFDQNVQTTWDRFTGQVVPLLDSVKARLGLTDYRVILDETTTTPDLIDRNIMYAKIFLKPARAIEFIAIDFVITSTGASFED